MMGNTRRAALSVAASLAWTSAALAAPGEDPQAAQRRGEAGDDVIVNGARAQEARLTESGSATGLSLSLRQTPQSVTVVDRQRIEDFALTNVNDLLSQTVGINVQRAETDRTEYDSRGFDITNFQIDGIGLPLFYGLQTGDLDTVLFERVEAVRGANAIMTGVGNPSATINYQRKRPTRERQLGVAAYGGSFDTWRLEGDATGAIDAAGTLRLRAIGAHEERHSYLDYNRNNRDVAAGLVAWDPIDGITATIGFSHQDNRSRGPLWGALPLVYDDGSRIDYARSASTSADWTRWNVRDQTAFAEIAWRPGADWSVRGVYTRRWWREYARILYAFGAPDRATGLGIFGLTGIYPSRYDQYLIDGYAAGGVTLFGRRHQLAFGVSNGISHSVQSEASGTALIDYGDIRRLADFRAPEVSYDRLLEEARFRDRLTRAYGSARINWTDRLKTIVGATAIWLRTDGLSYGADQARRNSAASPYLSALYDFTAHLTAYASYTDIFNPQAEVTAANRRLDPAKGSSIEGGLKGDWLEGRLYASAAVFRARQSGLAVFEGYFGPGDPGRVGDPFYVGQTTTSRGVEVEVAGRVADRWLISTGVTHLSLKAPDTVRARPFIPRDTFKLAATYSLAAWRDLKLGTQMRFQSRIANNSDVDDSAGNPIPIRQDAYATIDLLAGIRLFGPVRADLNLRNLTNAKYLGTLKYGQAFYAAPRSVIATVRAAF